MEAGKLRQARLRASSSSRAAPCRTRRPSAACGLFARTVLPELQRLETGARRYDASDDGARELTISSS